MVDLSGSRESIEYRVKRESRERQEWHVSVNPSNQNVRLGLGKGGLCLG